MTMKLQPDEPDKEFRTIFKKAGTTVKVETSTAATWAWNTLKMLKKIENQAIGFLKRSKEGILQLESSIPIDKETLTDALLDHVGVDAQNLDSNTWGSIPQGILDEIKIHFGKGSDRVAQEWNAKNEEGLTGSLFGTIGPVSVGSWEFRLSPVEFSSKAKENHAGADVALLMHVTAGDSRAAIKTLWFQAKKDERKTGNLDKLQDLPDQLTKMRKVTSQSFPLLYSRRGVVVASRLKSPKRTEIQDFIVEALKCKYGDPDPKVFADSIDRTTIFELAIKKKKPKKKT